VENYSNSPELDLATTANQETNHNHTQARQRFGTTLLSEQEERETHVENNCQGTRNVVE